MKAKQRTPCAIISHMSWESVTHEVEYMFYITGGTEQIARIRIASQIKYANESRCLIDTCTFPKGEDHECEAGESA